MHEHVHKRNKTERIHKTERNRKNLDRNTHQQNKELLWEPNPKCDE